MPQNATKTVTDGHMDSYGWPYGFLRMGQLESDPWGVSRSLAPSGLRPFDPGCWNLQETVTDGLMDILTDDHMDSYG